MDLDEPLSQRLDALAPRNGCGALVIGEMALASVRYGAKDWMRPLRHQDGVGDAETLITEVGQAFDALPGALFLSAETARHG